MLEARSSMNDLSVDSNQSSQPPGCGPVLGLGSFSTGRQKTQYNAWGCCNCHNLYLGYCTEFCCLFCWKFQLFITLSMQIISILHDTCYITCGSNASFLPLSLMLDVLQATGLKFLEDVSPLVQGASPG